MDDRDASVSEDELHAYLDGELSDERRARVEAWLAAHPEDAARVASWRAQAMAIQTRYGAILPEPLPADLDLDGLARRRRLWRAFAAALVMAAFLAGGLAGWLAHSASAAAPSGIGAISLQALDAHQLYVVEVRHPVEVAGSERQHLVQWLSKRLDRDLLIPDLEANGLRLVGGRLLPGAAGPAAFFMYEGNSGDRFTIYYAPSEAPPTSMRYRSAGRFAALSWVEQGLAYVVSGPADRDRLQRVAQAAYDQIDRPKRISPAG